MKKIHGKDIKLPIQYGRHALDESDERAVLEVLRSDFLTQGPVIGRFESALSEACQSAFAVAFNSATSALHVACRALEIGEGDVVWTSAITFVSSSNCALYCGASIDFVDVDPLTNNISVDALKLKLEQAEKCGVLPKLIIVVHLAGLPCDMIAIRKLSFEYGFMIIEDASHAVGASYNSQPVGNCRHSEITVLSFHPVKIITSAEGGVALTNDPKIFEVMTRMRSHGIVSPDKFVYAPPDNEVWNYQQIDLGYNYRMTDIQAALGLSQLARLDTFVEKRKTIARVYNDALSGLPIQLPIDEVDRHSSWHLYIIKILDKVLVDKKPEIFNFFHQKGILVNLHYIPVYRQPYYQGLGFRVGYCPEAENYFKRALSIPIHPNLTELEQAYTISVIEELLSTGI